MDFCNRCGILLNLEIILDNSTQFCSPCREAENPVNFPPCDCELCGSRLEDVNTHTPSLQHEVTPSAIEAQYELKLSGKSRPNRKEKRQRRNQNESTSQTALGKKQELSTSQTSVVKKQELSFSQTSVVKKQELSTSQTSVVKKQELSTSQTSVVKKQELLTSQTSVVKKQGLSSPWSSKTLSNSYPHEIHENQLNQDWDSEFPKLGSNLKTSSVLNDWATQKRVIRRLKNPSSVNPLGESLDDWGKFDIVQQQDIPWDDMGVTSSISSNPVASTRDGGDERNTNKGNAKNYHLVEELRVKWEKEQTEYRSQMSLDDTPAIAALVSGQRRKSDGSRYFVAGVDISFIKGNNEDACACLSVVRMPDLKLVYQRMEMVKLTQPYIPGFLAFREVPALEPLFGHLKTVAPQYWPDITLVDGNGKLHPRGFGLACHLGVVLDIPTMGVAKSLISAQGITEDDAHKKMKRTLAGAGDKFDLVADSGDVLGMCLRVHDGAPNPVYISVGHKVSLESAKWLALECSMYRIPEPVRRADLDSREYLRKGKKDPEEFIFTGEDTEGWHGEMEEWQ